MSFLFLQCELVPSKWYLRPYTKHHAQFPVSQKSQIRSRNLERVRGKRISLLSCLCEPVKSLYNHRLLASDSSRHDKLPDTGISHEDGSI